MASILEISKNFLESAIGRVEVVQPVRNQGRRVINVRPPRSLKNYAAAQATRYTADWQFSGLSANEEIRVALKVLRDRAREQERNNDYVRRFINLAKKNVVGANGILLKSNVKDPGGEPDTLANGYIETSWKEFCRKGSCTVCGMLSMIGVLKLLVAGIFRDGEFLVRQFRNWQGNKFGYALQLIEVDQLDVDLNMKLRNGNRVIMGIEIDRYSRPVNYYILVNHPGDNTINIGSRKYAVIPAREIIFGFIPERVGQIRAVSPMVAAMLRMKMLSGYEEAELIAARVASAKMGFIYEDDPEGYVGDDDEGDEEEDDTDIITEVEPGVIEKLTGSQRFEAYDPTHPTSAYKDFVKGVLRGVSSGLNVSYSALANDLENVNYSSIRQGALDDRDVWRDAQVWLVENFLQISFEGFLEASLARQVIPLPLRKFNKFNSPIWRPRGWQWVDPLKETMGNIKAVQNGFKSIQDVCAEQGREVDEVFEQLKREKELAEEYGLSIPALIAEAGKTNQGVN